MLEIKESLIRDKKTLKGWTDGAEERLMKSNPKELEKIKEKVKETFKDYDPAGTIYLWEILSEYVKEVSDILDKKLTEAETLYEKALEQSKNIIIKDIDVIDESSFDKNKYGKQPYQFNFNEEDILENFNVRSLRSFNPKSNYEKLMLSEYKENIYKLFKQIKSETSDKYGKYNWTGKPVVPTVGEINHFFEIWNWYLDKKYFTETKTFRFIKDTLEELENYAMNTADANEKILMDSGNKDVISYRDTKQTYNRIKHISNWFNNMFGEKEDFHDYEDGKPKKSFNKIDEAFIKIINSVDIGVNLGSNYMKPLLDITSIPLDDYFLIAYREACKEKNKIRNFADFIEKYLGYIIIGVLMIFVAPIYNGLGILIDILFLLVFYEEKERTQFLAKKIDYNNYKLGEAVNELEEKIDYVSEPID